MLKFIRKYQMLILVVGGSLLMVVFLLQPVLTRLAPSPLKSKVATLGDGTTFTQGDIIRAQAAITLLTRSNPRALQPMSMGGLGLELEEGQVTRATALHWLMLADLAQRAGLVGEVGDGMSWIDEIAENEALIQVQTEIRQGLIQDDATYQQRIAELKTQIISAINRNANAAAANMNGSMEDVFRTLAEARGMYRLVNTVYGVPSFSDAKAIDVTRDMSDAVAVNAALIDSALVAGAIDEPTDSELAEFFDRFRDQQPGENDFGIGYQQPTRIKLGWITLNKQRIKDAIEIDRVEIQKIWQREKDNYTGDFAAERFNIEEQYREEQAASIMVEADRQIRAQVLSKTSNLTKVDGVTQLPDNWEEQAPKLDEIAQAVTARLNEQFGLALPALEVNIIGDRWLSDRAIISLPGIGFSTYRIGSRQIPLYTLPQFFEPDAPTNLGLDVQPMLPIVDHAATDQNENRYYAMVIDVREAGPADSIDDAGREQVLADYKSLKGFELLQARSDELAELIRENDDLAPAINMIMSMIPDSEAARPSVFREILVRKGSVAPGRIASNVDQRLNAEAFREDVLSAASDLDPLITPEKVQQNPIVITTALPQSRSLALGLVLAPRPLTIETYRVAAASAMRQATGTEMREAGYFDHNPFSYTALTERFGLEILKKDEDES